MIWGYYLYAALTRSIEAWGAAVVAANPNAFIYRGADLRFAAERHLFFHLANDPDTILAIQALRDGTHAHGSSHPFYAMVSPYFSGDHPAPFIPPIGVKRRFRTCLGNLRRLLRNPVKRARVPDGADILFLVIHPKFVTFLRPIADALGRRAAFLTYNDKLTSAHLEKLGLPSVTVGPSFSPHPIPPGLLEHFVSLCRAFDDMSILMCRYAPRVIIVPEGNAPIYEIAHRAGLQHGVVTICMQHGAPCYTNPGFRNWSFESMYVWGEQFVDPFARYNPGQKFEVMGTPAHLPDPTQRKDGETIRSIGFFLQKGTPVIPPEEWDQLLGFIGWAAQAFPALDVIVRDHPTQPHLDAAERGKIGDWPNVRFMPPPEFSLNDVLAASDVVVAAASTTLLEAVQAGAVPFIFGTAYPKDFPDITGISLSAPDLESAKAAFTRLVAEGAVRLRDAGEKSRPALFAASGPQGAARIAQALAALAG